MAFSKNVNTIAFPTIGCGKLGFRPRDVVRCFLQAEQETSTRLKIFIIAREENFAQQIQTLLQEITSSEASHSSEESIETAMCDRVTSNHFDSDNSAIVTFHINATSMKNLHQAKEDLIEKITDLSREESIMDDVITSLNEEQLNCIIQMGTSDVRVKIDKSKNIILLNGEKRAVSSAKVWIRGMLLSFHTLEHYPVYWKCKIHTDSASGAIHQRVLLDSSSTWYREVYEMVMKTWEQSKVGKGKDAKNLGCHSIKIINIFCNESPALLERYMAKRKQMSKAAARIPFHKLKDQNDEAEVMTMSLGLENLYGTLDHQVNEAFVFHGTKPEALSVIEAEGLDTRICGRALFGYGSYFAESSTKADQYTDSATRRAHLGEPLHMYVCRILLGSSYICSDPSNVKEFKRPPCMRTGCNKDRCLHLERYDSVVGTHRDHQRRLNFREFIVYHPDQSYPDFVIEYQRVQYA